MQEEISSLKKEVQTLKAALLIAVETNAELQRENDKLVEMNVQLMESVDNKEKIIEQARTAVDRSNKMLEEMLALQKENESLKGKLSGRCECGMYYVDSGSYTDSHMWYHSGNECVFVENKK